jgi:hypothetical protein
MEVLYRTKDGKTFTSEREAHDHETAMDNVRTFEIYAHPELNEGAYPAKFQGFLLVNANDHHFRFAEDWCYKKYGNRIEFVQGVYGSNAIVENWRIVLHVGACSTDKVIGRIEERFVKHIWD